MTPDRNRPRFTCWGIFALVAACLVAHASPALAKDVSGSLDRSFGVRGITSAGVGEVDMTADWIDAAPLPDGSTYVLSGVPFRVFKLGPDGELDMSFGDGGALKPRTLFGNRTAGWSEVHAAPDGGPVLIGNLAGRAAAVLKLEPDGDPDKSFGSGRPIFVRSVPNAIGAVDRFGRVVLVSNRKRNLTRLKANGVVDTSFGDGGVSFPEVPWSTPYAAMVGDDGIYVTSSRRIFRLKSSGGIDLTFNGKGYVNVGGRRITQLSDGLMVQSWSGRVHRFNPDGSPYPGYGESGNGSAFGLAATNAVGVALPDGSVLFVTDRTDDSFDQLYDLTRLDPSGQQDMSFGGDGRLEADWLDGGPLPDSWATAGGRAAFWGGKTGRLDIGLVDASGAVDPDFGGDGIASIPSPLLPNISMTDSARRKDGSILAVGTFARSQGWDEGVAVASVGRSGRPETSFGDQGHLVLSEETFRTDPKPKLTLLPSGGAMVCAKQGRDSVVWRMSRNGRLVEDFGDNGRLLLPFPGRCQDISFDGRGAVLSAMGVGGERLELDLIRITPNGEIDTGYGEGGVAVRLPTMKSYVEQTRLFPDRKGRTLVVSPVSDPPYIARFTRAGRPDTGFGIGGIVYYGLHSVDQGYVPQKPIFLRGLGGIRDIAQGRGGAIFMTGTYSKLAFVGKLGPSGFPVRGFGKGGIVKLGSKKPVPKHQWPKQPRAYGIGAGPNGSLFVTGYSRPFCDPPWGCSHPLLIKKLRPNGSIDRGFERRAFRDLREFPEAVGQDIYFDGEKTVVTGSIEFAPNRSNFMVARLR